jgi:hypothetical protein
MGFRYTPLVAQTAVCVSLRVAAERLNLTYKFNDEEIPAPIMVWLDKDKHIVMIAIVWYDNIFITSRAASLTEAMIRKLQGVFQELNIAVKGTMERSVYQVEYLGVQYSVISKTEVLWKHTSDNQRRWARLRTGAVTGRQWLERLGVANWHIRLREIPWEKSPACSLQYSRS